jgi:hypothetical protein
MTSEGKCKATQKKKSEKFIVSLAKEIAKVECEGHPIVKVL